MKKIKSLLCLFVALALGLVCVLPAYAEETAEVSYAVDAVRVVTWTDVLGEGRRDLAAAVVERIWSLLPERLRERLDLEELLGTMDLSSLLLSVEGTPLERIVALFIGGNAGVPSPVDPGIVNPDTGDPTPQYGPPATLRDGQPYVVEKLVVYNNESGAFAYSLCLRATFVNVRGRPVCIKAQTDVRTDRPELWKITAGKPATGNGEAACEFTVSRLFTGVPVSDAAVRLTVKGFGDYDPDTGFRFGDVNRSGGISAADARTVLRIAVELEAPDEATRNLADRDRDGKVTAADARAVLRLAAGLEE